MSFFSRPNPLGLDKGAFQNLLRATLTYPQSLTFRHRHPQKCLLFFYPNSFFELERKKHLHNLAQPDEPYLSSYSFNNRTLTSGYSRPQISLQLSSTLSMRSVPLGLPTHATSSLLSSLYIPSRPKFPVIFKIFHLFSFLPFYEFPSFANQLWGKDKSFNFSEDQAYIFRKRMSKKVQMLLLLIEHHSIVGYCKVFQQFIKNKSPSGDWFTLFAYK